MKNAPPVIDQLKSWSGIKRHLANGVDFQKTHRENEIRILFGYVATGTIAYQSPPSEKELIETKVLGSSLLGSSLTVKAITEIIDGCRVAGSEDAQRIFANAVLYKELGSLQNFFTESKFPARFGRKLRMFSARHAGWLGLAAAVGSLEVVERWAPLLIAATREGYSMDVDTRGMQHWMLRLWCKVHALEYPDTGYPRYDVAEGILEIWDTEDLDTLGAWLVQLCNLHTRLAANKQFMDFSGYFSHFPVEVLMLFRLREQAGLENPDVDHPIMRFPWSRLWSIKLAEPDELLSAVYRRLEMDEGVTVQGLYRQLLPV